MSRLNTHQQLHAAGAAQQRHCVSAGTKIKDFRAMLAEGTPEPVQRLSEEVADFAKQFPTIGFDKGAMRYTE